MLDGRAAPSARRHASCRSRSEEHTSELQSQSNLVCRLLLEKKKRLICACALPPPSHIRPCPSPLLRSTATYSFKSSYSHPVSHVTYANASVVSDDTTATHVT